MPSFLSNFSFKPCLSALPNLFGRLCAPFQKSPKNLSSPFFSGSNKPQYNEVWAHENIQTRAQNFQARMAPNLRIPQIGIDEAREMWNLSPLSLFPFPYIISNGQNFRPQNNQFPQNYFQAQKSDERLVALRPLLRGRVSNPGLNTPFQGRVLTPGPNTPFRVRERFLIHRSNTPFKYPPPFYLNPISDRSPQKLVPNLQNNLNPRSPIYPDNVNQTIIAVPIDRKPPHSNEEYSVDFDEFKKDFSTYFMREYRDQHNDYIFKRDYFSDISRDDFKEKFKSDFLYSILPKTMPLLGFNKNSLTEQNKEELLDLAIKKLKDLPDFNHYGTIIASKSPGSSPANIQPSMTPAKNTGIGR
ncbi:MAG: hypothetical protein FJX30_01770 [Alphaproteobacteria bacterium]|nr:hypothetical protein [Alphaproteobacteria bacterium]